MISVLPLVLLGLSYAAYAVVLWGSLPYMVEARMLGAAFGICTVFQNLGTAISPPILGFIEDATKDIYDGYLWVEFFFTSCSVLSFLAVVLAHLYDKKKRHNLL